MKCPPDCTQENKSERHSLLTKVPEGKHLNCLCSQPQAIKDSFPGRGPFCGIFLHHTQPVDGCSMLTVSGIFHGHVLTTRNLSFT